ncbi:Cyclopropane-fatty-acyl-phospholipid synthase [Halomicronema hongdechloris C2206]|uniref:Cyclopropane-fatty-acyl-phospholipid synthase n=1 Tax=Halomicronema hongdechloris C2206 TaxID=1641165 RepID=A0A1Z3HS61_9CYAN|nr:class I SAM-dependent methyltransferase [Halomicronema hongdechloris]ASC73135.1 Cyclopropane-fatty-acyl-phospholipid synthase [Halomicronema hongdechloris C2206]
MTLSAPPSAAPKTSFKAEIRDYFNRLAPDLDRWSQRNRLYYRDLEQLHQQVIPPGSRVLEIGCGTGDLLHALAPSLGVGLDIASAVVEIARQKYPQLTFYCLDAEILTVEDLAVAHRCFDYIVVAGALGYLGDIQSVLQRLQAVCHRRTRLVLSFHNYMWEPILRFAETIGQRRPQPPQNWLSRADVSNLLGITGYIPLKQGHRLLLPKRLPGLSGWVNRYLAPLPLLKRLCLTNYVVPPSTFAP